MWHCPHCGAPQAETARCWVCHRSSTTCSTCVHFQRALAADLGYCARDPKRHPLTGREQRGCWEARPAGSAAPKPVPVVSLHRLRAGSGPLAAAEAVELPTHAHREFVPIETMTQLPVDPAGTSTEPLAAGVLGEPETDWTDRTSLFGDATP